jgi:hypothetical protein
VKALCCISDFAIWHFCDIGRKDKRPNIVRPFGDIKIAMF